MPANGANKLFSLSIWLNKWVTVVFPLVPVIPIQFIFFKLSHAIFISPITRIPRSLSLIIVLWSKGIAGLTTIDSICLRHVENSSNKNCLFKETDISSFSSISFVSKSSLFWLLSQTITLFPILLKYFAAQKPDLPNPITKFIFLPFLNYF